jgi:hypothetical protein
LSDDIDMNPDSQDAIGKEIESCTSKNVDDFLEKHGAPKSKQQMRNLVAMTEKSRGV